jgi:hypothetical protein
VWAEAGLFRFWEDVRNLGGIDPDLQHVEQGDRVTLAIEEELY